MKRFAIFLGVFVVALTLAAFAVWSNKANIVAHFLSKQLGVPTSIQSLDVKKDEIHLSSLWIGNPPQSKTPTSFSVVDVDIETDISELLANPLVIEKIEMKNIFVGVEYYNRQDVTNWTYILKETPSKSKKSSGRDFLIKKLILKNLTVQVVDANGNVKRYPAIAKMEFENITNETGFPVEEIEKAIFNMVIKELFQKLNLDQILRSIPGKNPLKYLPNFFSYSSKVLRDS